MTQLKLTILLLFICIAVMGQEKQTYTYKGKEYQKVYMDGKAHLVNETDTILVIEETNPEFSGGIPKLIEFLQDELKYPRKARRQKVQGVVHVGFIVDAIGIVDSVHVKQSVREDLDKEAMRVVKKMPAWKPGTQDGKPVAVQYIIPISFKLPE